MDKVNCKKVFRWFVTFVRVVEFCHRIGALLSVESDEVLFS